MRRRTELLIGVLGAVAGGAAGLARSSMLQMDRPGRQRPRRCASRSSRGAAAHHPGCICSALGACAMRAWSSWTCACIGSARACRPAPTRSPPHASARAVLEQLVAGRVVLESLTVVEGWSFAQMRQALDAQPRSGASAARPVRRAADGRARSSEGRRPRDASFPTPTALPPAPAIAGFWSSPTSACRRELEQAWDAARRDSAAGEPDQALILASIIEKETGARMSGRRSRRCSSIACASACGCSPIRP